MLKTTDLLAIIEATQGKRSDADICRSAGLALNSITYLRDGKVPSLERAGHLLDAVDRELTVRRKGETIDPFAMHAAMAMAMWVHGIQVEDGLPGLIEEIIESYERFVESMAHMDSEEREKAAAAVVEAMKGAAPPDIARLASKKTPDPTED